MQGAQTPRICVEPKRSTTDGEDAALLMETYGNLLDPWQRLIVDAWLGKDEHGEYSMTSGGLAVPRQKGKNVCIEARELYGLCVNGEKILHTAHQVKTSKKSFRRLEQIFTNKKHPELMELVKHIRKTNGEEAIELENGGSIEYSARSRQAARGFDGISLIVYDEAQELTDDQVEAIMATAAASATGSRQIIYAGTPPYPNCPGTVFKRRRELSLTKPGEHDAWHEWSVEGTDLEKMDLGDHAKWFATNPSLGIHLTEEYTVEEYGTMSLDGFARERLGWWMPAASERINYAIDKKAWSGCASELLKPDGKTAFGVKFSPDGSLVTLCGAVCPENGAARISLIEQKPTGYGMQWLADWLNERYATASCVVIDGRNGVDYLIDKMTGTWRYKGSIIRPTGKDVIAAASQLVNEINEKTLTWYKKQEVLSESATTSIKRPIAGGWGFGGENSEPIEAAALALWGCRTSKRNPGRKMRIG
ncbi:MAG: hypothetical protein Q4B15_08695 [Lachnospiraceae bacterium]|nr:hypothetical protein [Lachnospiraceae bacterium]